MNFLEHLLQFWVYFRNSESLQRKNVIIQQNFLQENADANSFIDNIIIWVKFRVEIGLGGLVLACVAYDEMDRYGKKIVVKIRRVENKSYAASNVLIHHCTIFK